MTPGPGHFKARQFLENLAASGQYTFSTDAARAALGISWPALKVALNRLARQKLIASPSRGFHVVLPPEYRQLGCLPADQFIPDLMQALKVPYYAGLLTAAEYHGAAHQRPQEFQVFVEKARRPLRCGRVRVGFIVRKNLRDVPTQPLNTARGVLVLSTPEATALDLVGYADRAGGLNQIATVLSELADRIQPDALVSAASFAPLPWAQRLGYLLEQVGAKDKTGPLAAYVGERARESVLLLPKAAKGKVNRHDVWKLFINARVETEA